MAAGLTGDAQRFLRAFGVIVAVWVTLLAATAPTVERPGVLWTGVAATWAWSLLALAVSRRSAWAWGGTWLVVAVGLELLGPASGTKGWSVAGGSALLVIAAAALTQRRAVLLTVVGALSLAVLGRGVFVPDNTIQASLGTLVLFGFSAVSVWWLVRTVNAGEQERDELRAQVAQAQAEQAFERARAESAARLHDSVLQSLASIHRASDVAEARDHASRASAQLRAWLRGPTASTSTLRASLEAAVLEAGAGRVGFSSSGDVDGTASTGELVAAATEAVRNAVRHTAGDVRVYLEVRGAAATVWVSDAGDGFDPQAAPADRLGVRNSIVGRLERVDGRAVLRSGPAGSEWELSVPVATA